MSSLPRPRHALTIGLAVALGLQGLPLHAQTVNELADLVGSRGRDGEAQLESRGYTHEDTVKSNDAAFSYWWHSSKQSCVRVVTRDGRYAQIVKTSTADCGKKEAGGNSGAAGAAVAAGAIALLGIAALAHKPHERDERNYTERELADFERGYRDGLYNHPYHNYGNSRDYSDGFSRGVQQRSRESSYRSDSYYRGGYDRHVSVSDLRYRDMDSARNALDRRGFRQVGERRLNSGGNQWFFWNKETRQCVDIHAREHRVESISETGDYACR